MSMSDWRRRAYPIQVRIHKAEKWTLYSRHRDWGSAANRAYVEAQNAFPALRVELVDYREDGADRTREQAAEEQTGQQKESALSDAQLEGRRKP
jgi:hypothetical protein